MIDYVQEDNNDRIPIFCFDFNHVVYFDSNSNDNPVQNVGSEYLS